MGTLKRNASRVGIAFRKKHYPSRHAWPQFGRRQGDCGREGLGVRFFTGENVFDDGIDPIIAAIPEGAHVHINLDLDSLDPSIIPAVWVPTPGGLSYWHVSKLIRGVAKKAKIASFAMVEFVEERDITGTAAPMAVRLAATAIGEVLRSRRG
jgi:agmatinase